MPADGRSTRWDSHRSARREELVHAARRAVHRIGPDVSMEEIAQAAATSKSIVYRYFVDKPGLQAAVGAAVLADLNAALDEAAGRATTPRDALRGMVDAYLAMVEHSPNVYWFVTRPVAEHASAPLGPFMDAVATLVARPFARLVAQRADAVPEGDPSAPVDPAAAHPAQPGAWPATATAAMADLWGSGAVGFVRGAGEWWLAHHEEPGAPSREDLAERITGWLWAGPVGALTRTTATDPEEHR
ncbi:MAG TPA: TetR family transcriptional regulator [Actinotalea sp.]|nr:TetR family transcriptional regulator [Actinotalea sp.]